MPSTVSDPRRWALARAENRQQQGPIEELRDLEKQPAPDFLGRVQRSVGRRQLASDTIDLSWTVVQVMVLEAFEMIFDLLRGRKGEKGIGR